MFNLLPYTDASTYETIEANKEIAHDEQFLLLPQCFQLDLVIILSFIEIVHDFANMFSKTSAADFLYVEKG